MKVEIPSRDELAVLCYQNLNELTMELIDRLERIAALCRKHNNAGSNPGAHALAGKILKIVEGT